LFDEYLRVMMWEFKNYDRHGLIFLFLILWQMRILEF
jgi:hypothetical protein